MATTAAIVIAKTQRDIVSFFMAQNAVSPQDAVTYAPDRRIKRRQFERMRDAGVFEDTADGRFWLNVPKYDRWRSARRRRVGIGIGIGAALAAAAAIFAG